MERTLCRRRVRLPPFTANLGALDASGDLYGTTTNGGTSSLGTVYKLDKMGRTTVLHSFAGGADGANPYASLTLDAADNLYGTSSNGGTHNKGTVYKLDPTGHECVLHSFADSGTFTAAPGRDSGRTGGPPPLSAAVRTLRDYGGGLALAIKNEMLQRLE